jgi:peptide/nickel transport system permease protein
VTAYIIRRLVQALVTLIGVTVLVFIVIHLLPGGPVGALLGPRASKVEIHQFVVANGYNKPLVVQYFDYLGKLLHGNLGFSYKYNQTVDSLLAQNLPKTVLVIGLAYFIALVLAVPIGLAQAVRRNRPFDYVGTAASFIGYSMPVFWLGILLILAFSVSLHIFPPEGPQAATVGGVLQQPLGLVLPVATLTIITVALFSRYMRSSAIDNLLQDYVRTARAMGIPERRILYRYVLPNSILPIITLIGLSLPVVLSGALLVEQVFNYPGAGLLFWNAATTKDFPLLMGLTVVVGVATVLGSLLADILYAVADPRVRYS